MLTWLFEIVEKAKSDELLDFAYEQSLALFAVAATVPLTAYKMYNLHYFSSASINKTSLLGDNIRSYPLNTLFRTQDNYLLVIDEVVQMLAAQKRLYNPYTNQDLSNHDRLKLMKNEKINNKIAELIKKQTKAIKLISRETIEQLITFAKGLLNGQEIWKGPIAEIPQAQTSYEKFIEYYLELPAHEKKALENLWLDEVDWQLVVLIPYQGIGRMQFKDLLSSSAEFCVHTLGLSVLQLVYQLDPKANVDLNSLTGKYLNHVIKNLPHDNFSGKMPSP